jgi:glutathione S-transferase
LPNTTPDIIKNLVEAVPGDLLNLLGAGIGYGEDVIKAAQADLHQDLEALNLLLSDSPYLVAEYPTLADFAVAGLSLVLKFPADSYLNLPEALKGTGIPGIADNPAYETFFTWRDRLYADYRQPITSTNLSGSSPTSIEID